MYVVVVASGELPLPEPAGADPVLAWLEAADLLIAADGGLVHCTERAVWPHVLVGDLDSAPPELVDQARARGVEIVGYPSDKDATDLQLAMELGAERGASRMLVLGLFGGRIDHELANLSLLASTRWNSIELSGGDGLRTAWVVTRTVLLHEAPGTVVTLIPWGGDVGGATTSGMRWPLRAETLAAGSTRGVSNVCVDADQTVSVDSGTLLVVVDRTVPPVDGPS